MKKDNNFSKKSLAAMRKALLSLFVLSVFVIELQFVSVIVKAQIVRYENETGEYYQKIIDEKPANIDFKPQEELRPEIGFSTFVLRWKKRSG